MQILWRSRSFSLTLYRLHAQQAAGRQWQHEQRGFLRSSEPGAVSFLLSVAEMTADECTKTCCLVFSDITFHMSVTTLAILLFSRAERGGGQVLKHRVDLKNLDGPALSVSCTHPVQGPFEHLKLRILGAATRKMKPVRSEGLPKQSVELSVDDWIALLCLFFRC